MQFTPFDKALEDFSPADLNILRDVSEGWYIEYKSQLPRVRDLAKSLSSFANQYGGWLFLGVDENPDSQTAGIFTGVKNEMVSEVLESVRNAAKDLVRPQIPFQQRVINGPVDAVGLSPKRSVVVVRVPEGSNTPYIHNDGKIYIRIGDSSSPIPVTDKATFDLLYRRGENKRSYLKALVERSPEISNAEKNNCYLQLNILSDPYQTLGHRYYGDYSDFCTIMRGTTMPFDNIYTASNGFIARQVTSNNRHIRLLTWEFSRNCNSFITIPIPLLPNSGSYSLFEGNEDELWDRYSIGAGFKSTLISNGLEGSRILNLNLMPRLIGAIVSRHRRIVGQENIKGPFYLKARIENVWRTIPFIDITEYMTHIERFDFPVIQDSIVVVPAGTSLETFVISPELKYVPSETQKVTYDGPVEMWIEIMQALGIPVELLQQNAMGLLNVSIRESEWYRAQNTSG